MMPPFFRLESFSIAFTCSVSRLPGKNRRCGIAPEYEDEYIHLVHWDVFLTVMGLLSDP
ncbi:Protein of unknown function [Pyronema omphalodes CBS 100304]|uniref:Uncharacterized protein n=1 Tax=Pyronema omphalodes (strain CBS 100304) TaxID=1076935 RepID=U4L7P2_PYROM|nr:Protein of unknown function [Pyronema omphalodes CBS 100304]